MTEDLEPVLEEKPKRSKDFWLFFIFVDIIALVFFGFLLYQALSEKFSAPVPDKDNAPVKEIRQKEHAQTREEIIPPASASAEETALQQILAASTPPQEPVLPEIKPAPQPEIKPAPAQKKQSVIVEPGKGKTRKVTFKYFEPANSVSIVSGFTMTKPQALKKTGGAWQASFVIYPGEYKYLFIVDGRQTPDPNMPQKDGRSFAVIE